jgi:hypothetical protein
MTLPMQELQTHDRHGVDILYIYHTLALSITFNRFYPFVFFVLLRLSRFFDFWNY